MMICLPQAHPDGLAGDGCTGAALSRSAISIICIFWFLWRLPWWTDCNALYQIGVMCSHPNQARGRIRRSSCQVLRKPEHCRLPVSAHWPSNLSSATGAGSRILGTHFMAMVPDVTWPGLVSSASHDSSAPPVMLNIVFTFRTVSN